MVEEGGADRKFSMFGGRILYCLTGIVRPALGVYGCMVNANSSKTKFRGIGAYGRWKERKEEEGLGVEVKRVEAWLSY